LPWLTFKLSDTLLKAIRYAQLKKEPTAQIAHLVFADTKANAEKTKRAIFCQRSPRIMRIEI